MHRLFATTAALALAFAVAAPDAAYARSCRDAKDKFAECSGPGARPAA